MSEQSWNAAVFDRLYARDPDPWRFATSPYEAEKYADTLDLLEHAAPGRRFPRALELGCSIGVFTALLAPRCDALLGVDAAATALEAARTRCAAWPQVRFVHGMLPAAWPPGRFDLVVVSELLYFLGAADIARLAQAARAALAPGAPVLLANWTGPTDTPHTGEAAAERFIAALGFPPAETRRRRSYRLDLLVAPGDDGMILRI